MARPRGFRASAFRVTSRLRDSALVAALWLCSFVAFGNGAVHAQGSDPLWRAHDPPSGASLAYEQEMARIRRERARDGAGTAIERPYGLRGGGLGCCDVSNVG